MKNVKKLLAVVLAAAMVFAFSVTAFAQTVGTAAEGKGSISISNPSKGIEYKVYKIFDATVGANGEINYTKTGFTELKSGDTVLFKADSAGNITATDAAKDSEGKLTADAVTALAGIKGTAVATATSDGSTPLTFAGLDYGYYYVESGLGTAVSVDSTKPDVTITDKNSKDPHWDDDHSENGKLVSKDGGETWVDSTSVNAGDTVTFKLDITSSNYAEGKQIANFIISDDLPDGLTFGTISSVKVGGTPLASDAYTADTSTTAADGKFSITIPWVTGGTETEPTYTSKYAANAKIEILYTATLDGDKAVIAQTGNINEADFTWNYVPTTPGGENPEPDMDIETEKATVFTYAFALKKVDQDGKDLKGAVFTLPFYVNSTADTTDGAYIYAGTTAGEGLTNEVTSPENGLIVIKGLEEGKSVTVTEKTAPDGYNKIDGDITVAVVKSTETTTTTTITKYIDADGNVTDTQSDKNKATVTITDNNIVIGSAQVVVNKAGQELPETGGMGTTIFYIVGAILVVGAGVVLITRRRMSAQ